MSNATNNNPLDVAIEYRERGWQPIPIPHRQKGPKVTGWQNFKCGVDELSQHFNGKPQNIGVLLGEPSGKLLDVDLDCPQALAIAPHYLDATATFGRASSPESHWLYIADESCRVEKLADVDGASIIELRGTGGQTVFPGSTHEEGEAIVWAEAGEPHATTLDCLRVQVATIAAASLIARHWPTEKRHEAAQRLGASLGLAGWAEDDIERFVRCVAEAAHDEELDARLQAARDAADYAASGEPCSGWPKLAELIGDRVVDKARDWLGLNAEAVTASQSQPPSMPPSQPSKPPTSRADHPDAFERCRRYVETIPPAIDGQGGSNPTLQVACECFRFGLTESEADQILNEYNLRCQPAWSARELAHKRDDALKKVKAAGEVGKMLDDDWRKKHEGKQLAERLIQRASENTAKKAEPTTLLPVPKLDPALLPDRLRPWIIDIADRMQCPIDYAAVTALVSLGSVIGRRCAIRPKRHDEWEVTPNLWGGIVGNPGMMKSPPMQQVLKAVRRLETAAKDTYFTELDEWEKKNRVAILKKESAEKEFKKAIGNGEPTEDIEARLAEMVIPAEPTRRRYEINNTNEAKLGELLNQNPNGLLLFRDELVGLWRLLDKKDDDGAKGFYLECWNGTGRYVWDRIGRGTVEIEAACLSIVGAMTVGTLKQYLVDSMSQKQGDDGWIQRYQLLVMPDTSSEFENIDREPNRVARDEAYRLFENMAQFDPDAYGAERDEYDDDAIPYFRFDAEAQQVFDGWRSQVEALIRGGSLSPTLESHLAKYRSLVPALALLDFIGNGGEYQIKAGSVERAIKLADYFEAHARRIYSLAGGDYTRQRMTAIQAELLEYVRSKGGEIKPTEVVRSGPQRYRNNRELLDQELNELEALKQGKATFAAPPQQGGRQAQLWKAVDTYRPDSS